MKTVTYTPHGALPDLRGFAPALVAGEIARHLGFTHNVHVTAREGGLPKFEMNPVYGEIHRLGESAAYRFLFRKLSRLDPQPFHVRLANLCRRLKPDVLHAHQLEFSISEFRRVSRLDIPVVVHAHAVRGFDDRLGVADRYLAVSSFTRDQLIGKGFPAERIQVVPNGADTDRFSPADAVTRQGLRIALGLPPDCFVVAYVGRKQAAKGFVTFLKAIELLAARGVEVRGVCAGPIPADTLREEGYDQREVLRLGLIAKGLLIDLPALSHAQLVNVYRVADALLFASQFKGEQHPLVLIEGLAAGCAVITSRIAGICETVNHNEHAILMDDAGDAHEAAEHLFRIACHPDEFLAMRSNGRELARRKYDWRAIAGQVEHIYFSLC